VIPDRRGSGRPDLTCLYRLKKKTNGTNCEVRLNQEEFSVRNWRGRSNPEGFLDEILIITPQMNALRDAVHAPPFVRSKPYKRTDFGFGISMSVGVLNLNSGKGDYRQYRIYLRHGESRVLIAFTYGQWCDFLRALGVSGVFG